MKFYAMEVVWAYGKYQGCGKKAGVGVGTVSRALNGTGYVAEDTRAKILAIAEKLDYQPNELARNLFRNRTGIIGIVVPDMENPFSASC